MILSGRFLYHHRESVSVSPPSDTSVLEVPDVFAHRWSNLPDLSSWFGILTALTSYPFRSLIDRPSIPHALCEMNALEIAEVREAHIAERTKVGYLAS